MSYLVSFCSCVFFSVLLAFRLPRLGKRELILVLFVRLFDLCLFLICRFPLPLRVWEVLFVRLFDLCFFLICRFPLPLGVWEGLRFVNVALPGRFSTFFLHPSIQFTAEISTKQHVFLDTKLWAIHYLLISIQNQRIHTSISYPQVATLNTAAKMFLTALHFASNISALIRTLQSRARELTDHLCSRGYQKQAILLAIERATEERRPTFL